MECPAVTLWRRDCARLRSAIVSPRCVINGRTAAIGSLVCKIGKTRRPLVARNSLDARGAIERARQPPELSPPTIAHGRPQTVLRQRATAPNFSGCSKSRRPTN
jgi:hypothetical protein